MLKRVIAGVAVAVMLAGSAAAGPVEDGAAAYKSGDYAKAVKMFRLAADQGIAPAQSNLGIMYAEGQGVPQDYSEAVKWYRLAADQGDATAQSNLGLMYAEGRGVTQDYAEAVKWYRLAADQGHAGAQFSLGIDVRPWPRRPAGFLRGCEMVAPRCRPGLCLRPEQPRRHVRPGRRRRPAGLRTRAYVVQPFCRAGRRKSG